MKERNNTEYFSNKNIKDVKKQKQAELKKNTTTNKAPTAFKKKYTPLHAYEIK